MLNIFHVLLWSLYIFFDDIPVQVSCLILISIKFFFKSLVKVICFQVLFWILDLLHEMKHIFKTAKVAKSLRLR